MKGQIGSQRDIKRQKKKINSQMNTPLLHKVKKKNKIKGKFQFTGTSFF